MNYKVEDKIRSSIFDWVHHYIIEDINVENDSRGTILLSCVYQQYGDQKPVIFERGERLMTIEKNWFTENSKRKISLIFI